jgi:transcription elongation GreA/GreB family factor
MTARCGFAERRRLSTGKSNANLLLVPVGTAILGYREGAVVEWSVPFGQRWLSIEKILYQPEAAGDYHL